MKKMNKIAVLILGLILTLLILLRVFLSLVSEPLRHDIWGLLNVAIPILCGGLLLLLLMGQVLKVPEQKKQILFVFLIAIAGLFCTLGASFLSLEYPAKIKTTHPTLEIRVPMEGEVVVAWGGDDVGKNYHAAYPDQRWAYDLVVEPHSLRSETLSDYGCFGKAVLAPVSGEIRTAQDGDNDRVPNENAAPPDNVYGNYIVIKPDGQDTRLIIAHLKKDSLRVNKGDRVEEGQPIAECGNSGNTTEPHIHIHLVALHRRGEDVTLTGLPLLFRDHTGAKMPVGGFRKIDGRSVADGDIIMHKN